MAEIAPTLVGSSLCSLAIFLPFVMLGGVTGAFFRVLTLSMALMLGASLLLCLTLICFPFSIIALTFIGFFTFAFISSFK